MRKFYVIMINTLNPDRCPVCGYDDFDLLWPRYKGRCVTSQLFFLDDIELDNRICRGCGLIFNAKGTRGKELYTPDVWKPKPQVMSFGKDTKTSHERALDVFCDLYEFPEEGSLLDFGAGTGMFLRWFHDRFPKWKLSAIEPGAGFKELIQNTWLEYASNTPYYDVITTRYFDVVVVMSVLEHIPDPLHALKWIHNVLKPYGVLLMQHPNFKNLPGDLVCADHVNKFTIQYLDSLCNNCRFYSADWRDAGVFFYTMHERSDRVPERMPNCYNVNSRIAKYCVDVSRSTINTFRLASTCARIRGGEVAIFGASPIGSMAPRLSTHDMPPKCFVDENPNMWGKRIGPTPVIKPNDMPDVGITDLALAISPVYFDQVIQKMQKYHVKLHVPTL